MRRHQLRLVTVTGCVVMLVVAALAGVGASASSGTSSWLPSVTLSAPGQSAYEPQIAVDGRGNVVAVWTQVTDGDSNSQVYTARRPVGGVWSAPVALSGAGRTAHEARVAVNARGDAVAVWWTRSEGSNDRVESAHMPAGGIWSGPVVLSDPLEDSNHARAAIDATGNAVAVWTRYDADGGGLEWVRTASRPVGGLWSSAVTLSDQPALDAHVVFDGQGNALAVWTGYDGRIESADRPAGGAWSTPVAVSEPGHAFWPRVALDGLGNAVAVWVQDHNGDERVHTADRPVRGVWSTPVALSRTGRSAHQPRVAVNPRGDAVVVWRELPVGQEVDTVQAADRPLGAAWGTPVTLSSAGREAWNPDVVIDRQGTAIAVWAQRQEMNYQFRVDSAELSGGSWSYNGALSDFGRDVRDAQIVIDGQGNAVAVWWHVSEGDGHKVQVAGADRAGPASTMEDPSSKQQSTTAFLTSWAAADTWAQVTDLDVRYRASRYDGGFGPRVPWLTETTSSEADFRGEPGLTYCLSARARDTFSNVGAWSTERCTAVPVDDRTLIAHDAWTRGSGAGHYRRTYTVSRRQGAVLELKAVRARRIALLVTRMPGAGTVRVRFAGTPLGRYDLAAPAIAKKQVIAVRKFTRVRTGNLWIRVVSPTGEPVRIDGVIASRR